MTLLDICTCINKDLAGDALENQLHSLHDALFGSSQNTELEHLQASINTAVEELRLKINGKFSRKSLENPAFVAEACLLLGIALISSCRRSSFEPKVNAYLLHLENILLPRIFNRTQIAPNHFRNILLKNPISCFVNLPESEKKEDHCNNLQELLKTLKINFGIDLLLKREDSTKADIFEGKNTHSKLEDVKNIRTRIESFSHPPKKRIQLCTPRYLLTQKKKVIHTEKEATQEMKKRERDNTYHTPENSDDDVLERATPEKHCRI